MSATSSENFPTSNGFDEMYHMLPYYAGVYAYDDRPAPELPEERQEFMAVWNQVDLSQWDGKAAKPHGGEEGIHLADLATGDDDMRANAIDWLRPTPRTTIRSSCIFAS